LEARITITALIAPISAALGKGKSCLSIITSAIFALISFFYIYTLASHFKVGIYILQNRVVYDTFFNFYIINKYLDHLFIASGTVVWLALYIRGKLKIAAAATYGGLTLITLILATAGFDILLDIIALISVPLMISFLAYNRFTTKKPLNLYTNLSVNYLAIIGIVTGILSIIVSSATIFFFILPAQLITVRNYAYEIFLFFSSFSPVLIFLLVYGFPVKLLINQFMTGISKNNNRINALILYERMKWRSQIIYLSVFVVLSVAMVMIPHQPTINKDNQHVGADTGDYIYSINILRRSPDVLQFIQQAFFIQLGGDRPFAFIFLFMIVKIVSADISYTIDYIVPIILAPSLVLVVYYLTREMTSNDKTSLLAAFITVLSFHTLIGIYGGFYANWLGLIIGFLSFVFLMRYLKSPAKVNFIVYSALMILLLFTHVYSWSLFAIVTGIFLIIMLLLNSYPKRSIIMLLLVLSASVVIDLVRTTTTHSHTGIERDISISNVEMGLKQFVQRWSNLMYTTHDYLGGLFSNFIILGLGAYWLFRSNFHETSNILLFIFLSAGIIPLFFGDWVVQARILYNIPFQIPAAIALTYIYKKNNGVIMLLPICIWLLAMSVRALSNFHLVLP
jgi:hypothetical protein